MESLQPPQKSPYYLLIILVLAFFMGWASLTFLRPMIIELGCSEIALKSSNFITNHNSPDIYRFSYENVKARCIEDSLKNR